MNRDQPESPKGVPPELDAGVHPVFAHPSCMNVDHMLHEYVCTTAMDGGYRAPLRLPLFAERGLLRARASRLARGARRASRRIIFAPARATRLGGTLRMRDAKQGPNCTRPFATDRMMGAAEPRAGHARMWRRLGGPLRLLRGGRRFAGPPGGRLRSSRRGCWRRGGRSC